jgi:type IV secretory pathway VirB2 component (pilin)
MSRDVHAGSDMNSAVSAMCDMIAFTQGRFGRVMAMTGIMIFAWKCKDGKIDWQGLMVLFLGLGLMFAPKTLALFILPATVKGISGGIFVASQSYTPDEIITWACPNIR